MTPSEIFIEDAIKDKKIPEIAPFFISNDFLNVANILLQDFYVAKTNIYNGYKKFVVNIIDKQNKIN